MLRLLLMLLLFLPACAGDNPVKDGELFAVKGCNIQGSYSPPGAGYCFILLHGLGSDHHEWEKFCGTLEKQGHGYLAFDARGHGKSVSDKNGDPVNYRYFVQEWQAMANDLGRAVKYLKKKGIAESRMVIMGASLGANVALNYCAGSAVTKLILLSPGVKYAGIETLKVVKDYRGQLLIAASPGDRYAYTSSKTLVKNFPGKAVFLEGDGASHGAAILTPAKIKTILELVVK